MSKTGVLVCGHGSRDVDAIDEFQSVARGLVARLPQYEVGSGFLEFAAPILADGLEELRGRGVDRILAVPGMLFAAAHVKNDIPSVLNTYAASHPDIDIRFGRELAIDLKLMRAAGDRVAAAERAAAGEVPRQDSVLVVVGRGASDPDANSNVAKVTRMLWEGMGFGWAETCYSGVTFPLVGQCLDRVARLGFRRVVVFPYFLFTGVLVKRIYRHTDEAAARHPRIEFLKAGYLNDHPLVLDAFADRVEEILEARNNMNCQLCKYREQVLGFEHDLGAPQEGHHYHVQGVGTDADHRHHHHHGKNGEDG